MKTAQIVIISILFLTPLPAAAQVDGPSSRFELRTSGGWIGFADEGMIHHYLIGTSIRIGLTRRLGVEPELTYMVGPRNDRDLVLTPVVSYEFGNWNRVKPYALGAAGWMWHDDGFYDWEGAYHVSGGFGVRTQINSRWSVSPEFRLGWYPHMQFKVALGYRF